MTLTLHFDVEPDEHGIIDGRELAEEMVAYAFMSLVAYVDGCPTHTDKLFAAIANHVIHKLHEVGRQTGQLDATMWRPGLQYDAAAFAAHFEAARDRTRAWLAGPADDSEPLP